MINYRKTRESLIQSEKVKIILRRFDVHVRKRDLQRASTALISVLRASVVDENVPHYPGSKGEEVKTGVPLPGGLPDHFEIDLVYESCGLKGVTGSLSIEVDMSLAVKLVVNQRKQLIEGILVPIAPVT